MTKAETIIAWYVCEECGEDITQEQDNMGEIVEEGHDFYCIKNESK